MKKSLLPKMLSAAVGVVIAAGLQASSFASGGIQGPGGPTPVPTCIDDLGYACEPKPIGYGCSTVSGVGCCEYVRFMCVGDPSKVWDERADGGDYCGSFLGEYTCILNG